MLLNTTRENSDDTCRQASIAPKIDHLAPIPRRFYLIMCVVGLFFTSLVGYGFHTGYRISTTFAPLIDATMEIKLEATAAHLGLEEVLHNDANEDYHTVLQHVEEVMWYLRAMLEGGKNFEGTFVPVPDEELLKRVEDAQRKFHRLKAMTLQRLNATNLISVNDELDQEHDARYNLFIKEVDKIETRLQQLMSRSLNRFRIVQATLIAACFLIAVATGHYLRRFEQQRRENFRDLRRSHALLEKEIKKRQQADAEVRKAYEGLEQKVLERTQDLDIANKQLASEVIERRKVEQNLLKYQARLRTLSSELALGEERERHRIAQALHDGIGQNLSAISLNKITQLRSLSPDEMDAALDDICHLIKRMIEQTRMLIFDLAPSTLYELGLVAGVEELIDKFNNRHDIQVEFQGDRLVDIEDEGVRTFLFQAVGELLNNVTQHAGARTVWVSIRMERPNLRIDIIDDGIGFNASEGQNDNRNNTGLGIFKIHERLRYIDGMLEIESTPHKGTHAVITVPMKWQITAIREDLGD